MFSPLNDPSIADWFHRFDAAARHLPAEDRAAQHEELRQHLDALIAANVALGQSADMAQENALKRLGDAVQIGRKIDREWQQGQGGFRMDMKAIGFGVGFWAICQCLLYYIVWPLVDKHPHLVDFYLPVAGHLIRVVISPLFYFVIAISIVLGLKYPGQALKSALIWPFFWPLLSWWGTAWSIWSSTSQHWTRLPDGDTLTLDLLNSIMFFLPQDIPRYNFASIGVVLGCLL